MTQLDAIWDQLFPAEQTRIVRLLVEKVMIVSPSDLEVRLRQRDRAPGVRAATGQHRSASGGQDMSDTRIHKAGEGGAAGSAWCEIGSKVTQVRFTRVP
jgi:hypothetical protein